MYCFRRQYVGVQSNRLHTLTKRWRRYCFMDGGFMEQWDAKTAAPFLRAEPRWNRLLYINKRKGGS